jgi:hypothetical protein
LAQLTRKKMATEKPKAKDKAPKEKSADAPKTEAPAKDKTEAPAEAKADPSKNYSRGEGQKAVTQAYKDNWNAIYGKKKKKR